MIKWQKNHDANNDKGESLFNQFESLFLLNAAIADDHTMVIDTTEVVDNNGDVCFDKHSSEENYFQCLTFSWI